MNNNTTIKTVFLSLLAGFTGAYFFYRFHQPAPNIDSSQLSQPFSSQRYFNENTEANGSFVDNTPTNNPTLPIDFVKASKASTSCVVFIKTVSGPQQNLDWFFFGGGSSRTSGSGSGVIFSGDGYVVTNNHVIDNAETIEVIHNKRSYTAKIVGSDPNSDIAVLKIEGKNLPFIKLSTSKSVKVGEWVLAVGNPFNLTSTVTAGIVSAKGRNLNIVSSMFPIESFIQTDAAINPGNSGGALVNLNGELIGINTAIYSKTGSYSGYGFAVPADIVSKVVNDLIKFGEVQKGFFGGEVSDLDSKLASELKVQDLGGAAIRYIERDGAAEKAGLEKGDIIVKINDNFIEGKSNFDEELSYYYPGDKVKIAYKREGKLSETVLTLTNSEGTFGKIKREIYTSADLGADLETVNKVERTKYNIENGVKVRKVTVNGLLARLGLTEDFIVINVNRVKVETPQELEGALKNSRGRIIIEGINKQGSRGYYQFYF